MKIKKTKILGMEKKVMMNQQEPYEPDTKKKLDECQRLRTHDKNLKYDKQVQQG